MERESSHTFSNQVICYCWNFSFHSKACESSHTFSNRLTCYSWDRSFHSILCESSHTFPNRLICWSWNLSFRSKACESSHTLSNRLIRYSWNFSFRSKACESSHTFQIGWLVTVGIFPFAPVGVRVPTPCDLKKLSKTWNKEFVHPRRYFEFRWRDPCWPMDFREFRTLRKRFLP